MDDWWDYLNPFAVLGNAAASVVVDGWTAAMLGIWNAGLWMLKLALTIEDAFLVPDLVAALRRRCHPGHRGSAAHLLRAVA